jgi:hypothetical protein
LSGILFDSRGERMTPTHATKNKTRYRYYVSRSLFSGILNKSGQRIPASGLEALVITRINEWLADRAAMLDIIQTHTTDAVTQKRLLDSLEQRLANRSEPTAEDFRKFILLIVARIQVQADRIDLTLNPLNLPRWLDRTDNAEPSATVQSDVPFVILTIPIRLKRVGNELKMIVENGSRSEGPNAGLVRTLVRANLIRDRILADKTLTLEEVAKSEGIVPSYATRLFRLTLLAPDIISAILGGKQPPELTARKLLNDIRLPLDWSEQRRILGFA